MILGACTPQFAYQSLQNEDKMGGQVEVSAVDPVASMMAAENNALTSVASELQQKLKRVIDNLK